MHVTEADVLADTPLEVKIGDRTFRMTSPTFRDLTDLSHRVVDLLSGFSKLGELDAIDFSPGKALSEDAMATIREVSLKALATAKETVLEIVQILLEEKPRFDPADPIASKEYLDDYLTIPAFVQIVDRAVSYVSFLMQSVGKVASLNVLGQSAGAGSVPISSASPAGRSDTSSKKSPSHD